MDIFEIIDYENESTNVDFKRSQYKNNEELLKDIMASANASTSGNKYIVIGVKLFPNGEREFHSIPDDEFADDAIYQEIVRSNIEPEIKFIYKPLHYKGHYLGVFEIFEGNNQPYVMKKRYGKLEQGKGFIRKGSQNGLITRPDLERMYEDRFKKRREREVKFSYLHLLKHEFKNNQSLLWRMNTYVSMGPVIPELWTPSVEITEHFVLEAWDSLMRSGVIASLEFEEMETYRYTVKTIRDAIYVVREAKSNWLRILTWDQPIIQSEGFPPELKQPASPTLYLQQRVEECKQAIQIAHKATAKAIELLSKKHGL